MIVIDRQGHATTPAGFRAGALACGLKASGDLDLGLLAVAVDVPAAAVFTRNRVVAAPVLLGRAQMPGGAGHLRGVLVNAGNANACTGERGLDDARRMQALAAAQLACEPEQVLLLSTGVIGQPMDMTKVEDGIAGLPETMGADGGAALARAMMTTDTVAKHAAVEVALPGGNVTLGGVAKGSGMIHPDMATMLGILSTDAVVEADLLIGMLRQAADRSFNRITVDGDTSTNDTVVLLAGGASDVAVEAGDAEAVAAFQAGLDALCQHLARAIVRDGEGASRVAAVRVVGAASAEQARQVANTIATSPLVKTALAGGDPNWGRIVAAAGRSGVAVEPDRMRLDVRAGAESSGEGWLRLFERGLPTGFEEAAAEAVFGAAEMVLRLDLGMGDAADEVWTCDLTAGYVRINADYRT